MKRLMTGALLIASASAWAAVANVRQVEPGVRPVYNSGTGVMPSGAQEAMPKASQQLAKDSQVGVGFTPVMLGICTPVQVPGSDYDVGGLRLNIPFSTCCNFDGFDFGIVGLSHNHANGWLANVVSVAYGDGVGLHTGGVNYFSGDFKGLQVGFVNWIDSGDALQVGIYNGSYDLQGLQFGIINTATKMQGVQIGFVNVISYSDVPFFPFVNVWF